MSENVEYVDFGEEANRGTAEKTTIGTLPVQSPIYPTLNLNDVARGEIRGENAVLGDTLELRRSKTWNVDVPFMGFTEAGTTAGMMGTIFKHFFGGNSVTGSDPYFHMMYPVVNPFATANLGTKALTLNLNLSEGDTVKNHPFFGGRVKSIELSQEVQQPLIITVGFIGQGRDPSTTLIASPVFPAEALRLDYNNLTVYTGTITRTGTGPDFTDFTFGSATTIKPDKISVKLENPYVDDFRLSGTLFPDKTRLKGKWVASASLTIDWEAPGSGFESINEFNNWVDTDGGGTTNLFCHWDAGSNQELFLDLPTVRRKGGLPEFSETDDPMITLEYKAEFNVTTAYLVGMLLKNSAATI